MILTLLSPLLFGNHLLVIISSFGFVATDAEIAMSGEGHDGFSMCARSLFILALLPLLPPRKKWRIFAFNLGPYFRDVHIRC